jgi:hypothetical protein
MAKGTKMFAEDREKIKSSSLGKCHAMGTTEELEVHLHIFLNSALDYVIFCLRLLYSQKKNLLALLRHVTV